jgi:hypothetical protein
MMEFRVNFFNNTNKYTMPIYQILFSVILFYCIIIHTINNFTIIKCTYKRIWPKVLTTQIVFQVDFQQSILIKLRYKYLYYCFYYRYNTGNGVCTCGSRRVSHIEFYNSFQRKTHFKQVSLYFSINVDANLK